MARTEEVEQESVVFLPGTAPIPPSLIRENIFDYDRTGWKISSFAATAGELTCGHGRKLQLCQLEVMNLVENK